MIIPADLYAKNLNNTRLSVWVVGGGVSEPGLNRWPDN
jgi:hypothetical protein